MIVYIAGKISGDRNYKRKFEKIKAIYNWCGFTVLNPAELPYGMNNADLFLSATIKNYYPIF